MDYKPTIISPADEQDSGFVLFVAIIVAAILMLLVASIAVIAFREMVITTTGRDSQRAFYAADSGVECALHWYTKGDFSDKNLVDVECDGVPFIYDDQGSDSPDRFYKFEDDGHFLVEGVESGPCAKVEVEVTQEDGSEGYVIRSLGYDNCESKSVERGVRVRFTVDSGAVEE